MSMVSNCVLECTTANVANPSGAVNCVPDCNRDCTALFQEGLTAWTKAQDLIIGEPSKYCAEQKAKTWAELQKEHEGVTGPVVSQWEKCCYNEPWVGDAEPTLRA